MFTTKDYTESEINSVVIANLKLQYTVLLTQISTNAPVKTTVVDTIENVVIARSEADAKLTAKEKDQKDKRGKDKILKSAKLK